MRNLIIIVLAGVVVWLVTERMRLAEELATAKGALEKIEEERNSVAGTVPHQAGSPASKTAPKSGNPGWMQEHLDRGARALEQPGQRRH